MVSTIEQSALETIESISIANHFNELVKIQCWLDEVKIRLLLSEREVFKLDLVLCEAIPNIIDYGYEDEQNHTITIRLFNYQHSLDLEIIDDGIAFNPFTTEHYQQPTTLDVATITGRGIHLIKSFTDSQIYQRIGNLNILRVTMLKTPLNNSSNRNESPQ
ncbi:ATP-binding protein [Methylocucumis oryzae]|uniref:Histidine kinase/HSP90-like ATPase domain-containing protein n=1 Tax=Methylocucumis oryzae TaxID=1632867 RepID=A0A0F3ILU7_9GAMM|nr:ATP-binding protein [Methylocucumis oryzae]KJV07730.1 hypothetical protein VZ94_02720 [Methylocucumis oryzae]